ncbi:PHP domain-containing protein [Lacrimispora sp.]|uniref:PHP domain-containing protein n=1 Tax=Lacrimispora sp. TaxID=2719234 RepID=UPI002862C100|nr:PHP domain-containing protein [Lacrimispora sp.]MDR7810837.1 PHP domain-containing protein [Lacrimispora sp.]
MDERIYLLPREGNFYKANMHCHTTVSDGKLTPEEVKEEYQKRGYQIVAYTDHGKYCPHPEFNSKDFLALAGFGADIKNDPMNGVQAEERTFHMNFYDGSPDEMQEEKAGACGPESQKDGGLGANAYIKKMKQLGFLACDCHPYRSMQNYDDYTGLEGLFAMEIYHYRSDLEGLNGYNPQAYDEMLRCHKEIYCLASDGNKNEYPMGHPLSDSFGGFIKIRARELTYPAVMQALKRGDFYSSMGPEIHSLYIEGKDLVVKTSPVEKIYMKMEGKNCRMKIALKGESLEEARFPLTGREGYIRVVCRSEDGLYANSNAYFLKDLPLKSITEQET